ncbi:MAG: hypothetical protein DWQ05_06525 [Calditrichaeota bacterium]|nr:MAG: hypothetical protein DWQ05_06525 [Calditrichota bacterium]
MKPEQIRDLNIGGLAAEHDNLLSTYFFETSIYRRVALRHTKILIGNRGSGKSAIFKMLAQQERKNGTLVEEIVPSDYLYDLLRNSRQFDSSAEWARLGAYNSGWKFVILVTAMKLLAANITKHRSNQRYLTKISTFLRKNADLQLSMPMEILFSSLKRFSNISKLSLSGVHFDDPTRELDNLYKLADLQAVIPAILELSKNRKIIVLFDELDNGWDASDDARQFIAGLFKAVIQINQQFPNIDVMVTIREEIYENIPELYDDSQKVRDLIEFIRWTPDDLFQLIVQRLRHALATSLNFKTENMKSQTLWCSIFEEKMEDGQKSTFNYIVERSLFRPREIIFFVNECLRAHNLRTKITGKTIKEVEKFYSRYRTDDIASEFKYQYPGLKQVIETFRLGNLCWERNALENHWLEIVAGEKKCPEALSWLNDQNTPDDFIETLWRTGFFRACMHVYINGEATTCFVGCYQEPSLNLAIVDRFDLHPMFRSYLGI